MTLRTVGGVLLAVGSELANSADCCCDDLCCKFVPCDGTSPDDDVLYLCDDLITEFTTLVVDEVYRIDGVCMKYLGTAACVGGETNPTSINEHYEFCNECLTGSCCCGADLSEVTVTIPSRSGTATLFCVPSGTVNIPCSTFAGTYVCVYRGTRNVGGGFTYCYFSALGPVVDNCPVGATAQTYVTVRVRCVSGNVRLDVIVGFEEPVDVEGQKIGGSTFFRSAELIEADCEDFEGQSLNFAAGLCNLATSTVDSVA